MLHLIQQPCSLVQWRMQLLLVLFRDMCCSCCIMMLDRWRVLLLCLLLLWLLRLWMFLFVMLGMLSIASSVSLLLM